MAREDDRDGVAVHHGSDSARGPRPADLAGERAVGGRDAVRDLRKLTQHLFVEGGDPQVERQVELAPPAVEVLVQLAPGLVERRAQDARPEQTGKLLLLALRPEPDAAEAAVGRGDEQVADRRADGVVADVDEPFANRGGPELRVELGCDGHASLLSLRTPEEAAARAASSEDPSASAIWA